MDTILNNLKNKRQATLKKPRTKRLAHASKKKHRIKLGPVKAKQAFDLRVAGWRLSAIAKKLECSASAVSQTIHAILEQSWDETREKANKATEQELTRLDEMQARLWKFVEAGDVRAIEEVRKIIETRASFQGLTKQTINIEKSGMDILQSAVEDDETDEASVDQETDTED